MQSKRLEREVFLEPLKDIKEDGKIWKLRKSLYGLNEVTRIFWLKVKKVFSDIGMEILAGDKAFYYRNDANGELEGMILSHVNDFNLAGTKKFIKEVTESL